MENCELELTPLQQRIAKGVTLGLTNQQIAQACSRSANAIKDQVGKLCNKCGVDNRTKLAVYLVLKGYVKVSSKELRACALTTFLAIAPCVAVQSTGDLGEARPLRASSVRAARREAFYA